MPEGLRDGVARTAYRLLLRTYPRAFRARYGESMTADFLRLRRAAGGPAGRTWLWLRTAVDLLATGVRTRLGDSGPSTDSMTRRGGGRDLPGDLKQDVLYAVRTLCRSPGYTLAVVLTLGLGIGANTAMFSVVHGVLLEPLPYAQGERVVHLRQEEPRLGEQDVAFSVHEIEDYRSLNHTLTDVVEYHGMTFTLLGTGQPTLVQTGVVSARFFDVLGMEPILGRTFADADDRPGADPVMILSYEFWRERFGADPGVVGKGYTMNDRVHTVIGVLPPIPQYPDENDVYMPTSQCPTRSSDSFIANRRARMMTVFGVLRPGTTVEAARTDLSRVASTLTADHPDVYQVEAKGYDATVSPLKEDLVADARPTLLILMATTLLVLVIACANVASLALARAVRRGQELAVRQAIGAGRGRLVRQLLTESTVLALAGGLVGVALARGSLDLLINFAGRLTPRAFEASLDGTVLTFAMAVSIVTGLFFGSVPALRRADAEGSTLGRGRSGGVGGRSHRAHAWLVGAQVSLAFVLLIGAGLLVRTFLALSSEDLGYQAQPVLSASITLPQHYYRGTDAEADAFFAELLGSIDALPGVRSSARTQTVPLNGVAGRTGLETEAHADVGPDEYVQVVPVRVSPEYLATLGIPVLAGRGLTDADIQDSTSVVVLSASLAQRLWPGVDPVDRRVRTCSFSSGQCGRWVRVVGVVGDVKMEGIEYEATPAAYVPQSGQAWNGNTVVIRTDGDLGVLARKVTELVHQLEPDAPLSRLQPLEAYVSNAVAPRKLTAALMGLLAALALAVTLAGVA
ncbi:MAG: ABC transporter permease, partial [Gemmatimonadota bacterium]